MSTPEKQHSHYPSNDPQSVLNGISLSDETYRDAVSMAVRAACRAASAGCSDHGEVMRRAAELLPPTAPDFDRGLAAGIALVLLAFSAR